MLNAPVTRYLKLPIHFDVAALERDLQRVQEMRWMQHYNKSDYVGDWRCLALRANNGVEDDILALDDANFIDTPVMQRCPAFQQVLQCFECDKKSIRLMTLAAGSRILPHVDQGGSFETGMARLHVPIVTHPSIHFEVDDERVHFSAGWAWYLNTCCLHAVRNDSAMDRVHLVIDCVPNAWLAGLFRQAGWVESADPHYGDPNINDANVEEIIRSLRSFGNERATELAEELSKQRNLREAQFKQ